MKDYTFAEKVRLGIAFDVSRDADKENKPSVGEFFIRLSLCSLTIVQYFGYVGYAFIIYPIIRKIEERR